MSEYENVETGRIAYGVELKMCTEEHTIEEKMSPWPWYLGYVMNEGDALRLYGCFSEEDVDKLIEEFKVTGKVILEHYMRREADMVVPSMVYKLVVPKIVIKKWGV
jgi:hypothetical protein